MNADALLYDGHCRFCGMSARRLRDQAGGSLVLANFRDPEVLARYPGVTFEACEKKVHLVLADGRIESGIGALVLALRHRWFGWALRLLLVPGLRLLAEAAYSMVSRYRFKISGVACSDGCSMYR